MTIEPQSTLEISTEHCDVVMMNEEGVTTSISCWPPIDTSVDKAVTQETNQCEIQPQCSVKRLKTSHTSRAPRHEMLADAAIAKWWRRSGRFLQLSADQLPASKCPNTLLRFIVSTDAGQDFLHGEVSRLVKLLHSDPESRSCISAALGSFYAKLSQPHAALTHLQMAVKLDTVDRSAKKCRYLMELVRREIDVLEKQKRLLLLVSSTDCVMPEMSRVERRSAGTLGFSEFLFNYAIPGRPVIITGLQLTTQPWCQQHIRNIAGDCHVTLKRHVTNSSEWAQLEEAEVSTVADFIDDLPNQTSLSEKRYLFDWSIPLHCPALAQQLVIPKYFAGDFLQRTFAGSLYRDSWPSLFLSPAHINSELHVDTFGSNFWMALIEGRKRWTFFDRQDTPLLYPKYDCSLDATFQVDLTNPNMQQWPLLALTKPMQCVLEPGELLFVPAGSAHHVENLATSLAISANYVDLSNLRLVCDQLAASAIIDERSASLLRQLEPSQFNAHMDSNVTHMSWSQFKSPPKDCSHFDY